MSILSQDDNCDNLFHNYSPAYREPFVAKEGRLGRAKSSDRKNWGKTSFRKSTFGIVPRGLISDLDEETEEDF